MNFEYGEPTHTGSQGEGLSSLHAYVANCTGKFNDDEGKAVDFDDACILLCRRTFGHGQMHAIPRAHFYMLLDDTRIDVIFSTAAAELFGVASTKYDAKNVGDLIYKSIDALYNHPPEDEAKKRALEKKWLERSGVVIKANDQIMVDTR